MRAGERVRAELFGETKHGIVTLRVRLFAIVRERARTESVEVDLAEGATVADAREALPELPALAGGP